ncbi:MAG: MarR family transcriptional regulator [Candidatus Bathyarchaeia archaeon]|nr:MarR family transcriptional regulator [Candidatus Bathyarchaeota archaeon]
MSKEVSRLLMGYEDFKKIIYSSGLKNEENEKIILDIMPKIDGLLNKILEIEKEISKLKIDFERIKKRDLQPLDNINLSTLEVNDALLNLTNTEIEVLTIIEENGEASVSEIKKRINKTREHTARLLKKLYDKGYIDRNSSRMPYRYYVRKELKDKIKRKPNIKASI